MINISMPRLSLYRPEKQNDYRFLDRTIAEMFQAGATDLYLHKYLGPTNQGPSIDYTQPQYDSLNPMNIQDLLFMENRDRTYEPNIIRLRGHYNVQNLDFDLSQFGLFLNNDILFITIHYNTMIDLVGRKLMVGDVLELPHLLDYNPLNETIPVSLRRYYQVTDGNYASEGFSPTWYPHLWRVKCEPLVDSQEFSQILSQPTNTDNYLGQWSATDTYPPGYVITYGDTNYVSTQEVPVGIAPPNATYWTVDPHQNLKDILSTYNKNIEVNDATLAEAARILPKSGYDNSKLYIIPKYGPGSGRDGQPAPPIDIVVSSGGAPIVTGPIVLMKSPKYRNPSPAIRVPKNSDINITAFLQMILQAVTLEPTKIGNGSGPVSGEKILSVYSLGSGIGPYGTVDSIDVTADSDLTALRFDGTITGMMDFTADEDPAYTYIARSTPLSFNYTAGYLTGSTDTPNGFPSGAGITFPLSPQVGDYFLRTDYLPQMLFRWDGRLWVRISSDVKTGTGFTAEDKSQLSGFINNDKQTQLTDGTYVDQRQPLSSILQLTPDTLPPIP